MEFRIVGTFIATALTACGIETIRNAPQSFLRGIFSVATVLTVYGIETL